MMSSTLAHVIRGLTMNGFFLKRVFLIVIPVVFGHGLFTTPSAAQTAPNFTRQPPIPCAAGYFDSSCVQPLPMVPTPPTCPTGTVDDTPDPYRYDTQSWSWPKRVCKQSNVYEPILIEAAFSDNSIPPLTVVYTTSTGVEGQVAVNPTQETVYATDAVLVGATIQFNVLPLQNLGGNVYVVNSVIGSEQVVTANPIQFQFAVTRYLCPNGNTLGPNCVIP